MRLVCVVIGKAADNAYLLFTKRHDVIIFSNRHNPRSDGRGSINTRRAKDSLKLRGVIRQRIMCESLLF